MDTYVILKDLAIIIVFAKLFGILARKCKAPQVVGELIAGIVLGPSVLGLVQQSDFLAQMAEIGVILLMFSAGLGTSLKDLLRTVQLLRNQPRVDDAEIMTDCTALRRVEIHNLLRFCQLVAACFEHTLHHRNP